MPNLYKAMCNNSSPLLRLCFGENNVKRKDTKTRRADNGYDYLVTSVLGVVASRHTLQGLICHLITISGVPQIKQKLH